MGDRGGVGPGWKVGVLCEKRGYGAVRIRIAAWSLQESRTTGHLQAGMCGSSFLMQLCTG